MRFENESRVCFENESRVCFENESRVCFENESRVCFEHKHVFRSQGNFTNAQTYLSLI